MASLKNILLGTVAVAVVFGAINREQLGSWVSGTTMSVVTLHADENGHFFGHLTINGTSLKYIVDSGASNVTINSVDAVKANIDYSNANAVSLLTSNGEVQAFSLRVDGLEIGAVVLNDVEVTVVDGDSPPYVLLGISAQRRLDIKRDNSVMTLGVKHE